MGDFSQNQRFTLVFYWCQQYISPLLLEGMEKGFINTTFRGRNHSVHSEWPHRDFSTCISSQLLKNNENKKKKTSSMKLADIYNPQCRKMESGWRNGKQLSRIAETSEKPALSALRTLQL